MTWRDVRPVALAVVRRDEEVLLARHYDTVEDYHFYRPLGGAIEFGEHSREAVVREFAEELDVTLTKVSYLDTFERIFTHNGQQGHQIWRLYEGDFEESWPYERDSFTGREPELDEEFPVEWKHPDDIGEDGAVVYPDELPELL